MEPIPQHPLDRPRSLPRKSNRSTAAPNVESTARTLSFIPIRNTLARRWRFKTDSVPTTSLAPRGRRPRAVPRSLRWCSADVLGRCARRILGDDDVHHLRGHLTRSRATPSLSARDHGSTPSRTRSDAAVVRARMSVRFLFGIAGGALEALKRPGGPNGRKARSCLMPTVCSGVYRSASRFNCPQCRQ